MGHVIRLLLLLCIALPAFGQIEEASLHSIETAADAVEPASAPAVEPEMLALDRLPVFALNPLPPDFARVDADPDFSSSSNFLATAPTVIAPVQMTRQGFQWGPAVWQSLSFLLIQQGGLIGSDKWTRWNMLHGKFFEDWGRSVKGAFSSGWDDGDPFLDNYIGHPVQGALTGYIQVQNDPKYRAVEFGMTKAYWASRLRAMAWTTAYSFQFEIGPISEASISNLGSYEYLGDHGRMTTGMGYVDFVMTPVGGLGWMMMEDALDRFVVKKLERKLGRGWGNFFRVALNPTRAGANVLRAKAPWYRDGRDGAR